MTDNLTKEQMLRRISSEYLEMPGLRLTCEQAQRLWGLDQQTCLDLLSELISMKFLARTTDGKFARLTEGAVAFPSPRMARATLGTSTATAKRAARY